MIATGCTAITLAKKAFEKYIPKGLIIVSAFSDRGLADLIHEFPNADIYVGNDLDEINSNGMFMPGIGNLDLRTNM